MELVNFSENEGVPNQPSASTSKNDPLSPRYVLELTPTELHHLRGAITDFEIFVGLAQNQYRFEGAEAESIFMQISGSLKILQNLDARMRILPEANPTVC